MIHRLRDSRLLREAVTLVGGNVMAQAISLVAYLVLMRIFSPTDYAIYNIFFSYIEVLIILSTCKYEQAIVVARDEGESAAMAQFVLRLNACVSVVLLTVVALLYLLGWLPESYAELGPVVLLIPAMVFFSGTSRIYTSIFNRLHRYKLIASNNAVCSLFSAVLKVVLGVLGFKRSGMPLGTVVGQAAANLLYRLRLRRLQLPATTRRQRLAAARRYSNFPRYVASRGFLDSFSSNLPFLWLAVYFDKEEVGLFGLAFTLLVRPVNVVASALERVLYARTAEQVRGRLPLWGTLGRSVLLLNAVALPVGIVMWVVAEPLFVFLFGSAWEGCGVYVQALLPWMLVTLNTSSIMFISNLFFRQRVDLLFAVVLLVLRVAAIAVGIHWGCFLTAVRLYAAAGTLVGVSLLLWYVWQVRHYERQRVRG